MTQKIVLTTILLGLCVSACGDPLLGDLAYVVTTGFTNGPHSQLGLVLLEDFKGFFTLIGDTGQNLQDIARAPNGNLYANTNTALYQLNPSSGASAFIGFFDAGTNFNSLEFSPSGALYSASSNGAGFFTVNTTTGKATYAGSTGSYIPDGDLAFDNSGNLYMTAVGSMPTVGCSANPSLLLQLGFASPTVVGKIETGGETVHCFNQVKGLAFDSRIGELVGFANGPLFGQPTLISIDTATGRVGEAVTVSGVESDIEGATFDAVPEPSTWTLFSVASAMLLTCFLRKRKADRRQRSARPTAY